MNDNELIKKVMDLVNPTQLVGETIAGEVGSALITDTGNFYTGISLHASCGIGTCGEHMAIMNMLAAGETRIERIVAAGIEGICRPCGRCRELMYQIDLDNAETKIIIDRGESAKLKELLPKYWQ